MAQRPLVSVIVPVYNASDYLAATLRSFEGQSYGNVEWVLVDDGSTDGSAQVCAEWCAADPLHRRLFRKQNGGASSARNTGLEHAMGAYVLFWDSDDTQSSLAIEKLVECSHGFDSVSVCAIRRMLPDGRGRDLFTCRRHESTPEEALDEWLRGGIRMSLTGIFLVILDISCHWLSCMPVRTCAPTRSGRRIRLSVGIERDYGVGCGGIDSRVDTAVVVVRNRQSYRAVKRGSGFLPMFISPMPTQAAPCAMRSMIASAWTPPSLAWQSFCLNYVQNTVDTVPGSEAPMSLSLRFVSMKSPHHTFPPRRSRCYAH